MIFNTYQDFKKQRGEHVKNLRHYHKINLTNGCFDILTLNHIYFLKEFFHNGGIHIILLDNNKSIKKIKGEHRPINDFQFRAEMIEELFSHSAMYIVGTDTDQIDSIIQELKPEFYFKGGDYTEQELKNLENIKKFGRILLTKKTNYPTTTDIENLILLKHGKFKKN